MSLGAYSSNLIFNISAEIFLLPHIVWTHAWILQGVKTFASVEAFTFADDKLIKKPLTFWNPMKAVKNFYKHNFWILA